MYNVQLSRQIRTDDSHGLELKNKQEFIPTGPESQQIKLQLTIPPNSKTANNNRAQPLKNREEHTARQERSDHIHTQHKTKLYIKDFGVIS